MKVRFQRTILSPTLQEEQGCLVLIEARAEEVPVSGSRVRSERHRGGWMLQSGRKCPDDIRGGREPGAVGVFPHAVT